MVSLSSILNLGLQICSKLQAWMWLWACVRPRENAKHRDTCWSTRHGFKNPKMRLLSYVKSSVNDDFYAASSSLSNTYESTVASEPQIRLFAKQPASQIHCTGPKTLFHKALSTIWSQLLYPQLPPQKHPNHSPEHFRVLQWISSTYLPWSQ